MTIKIQAIKIKTNNGDLYPTLIQDDKNTILVDTGFFNQFDSLKIALKKEGVEITDINIILLTHQDLDHIGGVNGIEICS